MFKLQDLNQLANKYGSPFFIYKESTLQKRARMLQDAVSPKIEVFYSMKANPNPFILRVFKDMGLGVEVASKGELSVALEVGFDPKKIFFTAPSKTESELRLAIEENILAINVDNFQELELIEKLANEYQSHVAITFRIHQYLTPTQNRGLKMTGTSSQFGVTAGELIQRLNEKKLNSFVRCIGVHTFQGSENFNSEVYNESWQQLIELCESLEHQGHSIEFLGLGGGFGYDATGKKVFDFDLFKENSQKILREHQEFFHNKRLMVESGNFLAREGGWYITRVLYTKKREDLTYIFVDGGTHHIPGESRFSRMFSGEQEGILTIPERTDEEKNTVSIFGKLCTPNDVLKYKANLPTLEIGDFIVFPNNGAYALTSSRLQFLSHDEPAEFFLSNSGEYFLTRLSKQAKLNFHTNLLNKKN
ncbi:hypothetical protein [Bacillus thuringiensis]|uniref:hypothetical protein n=1 Tax=Bacillus thuringiensis TaxID=1428 RepID=UPI000A362B2D|nr:hypothetical protein [Bacillus thuringiensis]OUA56155.1 hypothetical protein BK781_20055 [Bacillus thuringiensis serovar aizawai]